MAKQVLIVDDSVAIRQQVGLTLSEAGYDVLQAVDGLDGLKQLDAHPNTAMVICDVHMPNMGGLEMLLRLQSQQRAESPPFLMLTTEARPASVGEARSRGAKGWIVKPFKKDILLACVKKMADG